MSLDRSVLLVLEHFETEAMEDTASASRSLRLKACLRAGDVVEYVRQNTVAFSPGSMFTAVITSVTSWKDDWPVRLNCYDLLYRNTLIARTTELNGTPIPRDKRSYICLKNYLLIPGHVDVPTRADMLADGLHGIEEAAYSALRARMSEDTSNKHTSQVQNTNREGEPDRALMISSSDECESEARVEQTDAADGQPQVIEVMSSSEEDAVEPMDLTTPEAKARLDAFKAIPTAAEQRRKQHRAKDRHGVHRRPRGKRFRAMRTTTRDSRYVYNASTTKETFVQQFMKLPNVKVALDLLREKQALEFAAQNKSPYVEDLTTVNDRDECADSSGPDSVDGVNETGTAVTPQSEHRIGQIDSTSGAGHAEDEHPSATTQAVAGHIPAQWPTSVVRIYDQENPDNITFEDTGTYDRCKCTYQCYPDTCHNSASNVFCTRSNCAMRGYCGNSLHELASLQLFLTPECGYGVYTTSPINIGIIIGQYCGVLEEYEGVTEEEHDGVNDAMIEKAVWKHNTGYTMIIDGLSAIKKPRKKRGKKGVSQDKGDTSRQGGKYVYLEPEKRGSILRFVNHSCEANCCFRQLQYRTKIVVVMMTVRQIKAGEEITVVYQRDLWFDCKCKTPTCVYNTKRPGEAGSVGEG